MNVVAALLAIAGTLWGGLLLLLLAVVDFEWEVLLLCSSVVAVTVTYWVRALTAPRLAWCYLIWGLSLSVQGAWLADILWQSGGNPAPHDRLDWFGLSWFGVTFAVSAVALVVEHKGRGTDPALPPTGS